jgi:predicted ATPase/class 3 adenylate cyclase
VRVDLPTGTVTFLFTDLEGSTRLWDEHPESMRPALAQHDGILRDAVESNGGSIVKTTGDGVHAVFATAPDAVAAALEAQRVFGAADWGATPLRVRMGLHTGATELRDGDYYGSATNRAARLMAIAHGGQVIVSHVTGELIADTLPDGVSLLDLGEHRLRDLSKPERVFQVVAPGLTESFSPLHSIDARSTNLPVQLTSFVGRGDDVQAIEALLADQRSVTLTGVGGVGKTRLALQVAAESHGRYADGVWFVELASVEAARVGAVIAGALEIEGNAQRGLEGSLVQGVRSRELLLVLDNCEHIVREVRRVVELILREAPRVRVLVTSREGLRVAGEQIYAVPSLDDQAAVALFVERAHAVDPSFTLRESDAAIVADLCARLDGMPLAIELAAARVPMFSLEDLAGRLDQRFRLLTGGRGGVERHQTLRAAIDWSYDLLSPAERSVFARFSVFAGGCTLDAAEAVVADAEVPVDLVVDLLSELVAKSLVVVDRDCAETRYDMLESVRQYAQDRLVDLGDADATRARHANWYTGFARAAGRGLYSSEEHQWLERLRAEIDNLEVAVAWAVAADETDIAMRIGGAFPRQAGSRPMLGTAFLAEQAMLVAGANEHPLRARVFAEAAWAKLIRGGDADAAERLLLQSVEEMRGGARYAAAGYLYLLMYNGWRVDDAGGVVKATGSPQSFALAEEGLAHAEAAGDELGAIGMRIALAGQSWMAGHEQDAQDVAARALTDARRLQQPTLEAAALYVSALTLSNSEPERAIAMLHETLERTRGLGNDSEQLTALGLLAALEARHGDIHRSLEAMRDQSMTTSQPMFIVASNIYIGLEVFNRVGRPEVVARAHGQCFEALWAYDAAAPGNHYVRYHSEAVERARETLGGEAFDRCVAEGAAIPPSEFASTFLREIDAILAELPPA